MKIYMVSLFHRATINNAVDVRRKQSTIYVRSECAHVVLAIAKTDTDILAHYRPL